MILHLIIRVLGAGSTYARCPPLVLSLCPPCFTLLAFSMSSALPLLPPVITYAPSVIRNVLTAVISDKPLLDRWGGLGFGCAVIGGGIGKGSATRRGKAMPAAAAGPPLGKAMFASQEKNSTAACISIVCGVQEVRILPRALLERT
jgi:hypothetical protein